MAKADSLFVERVFPSATRRHPTIVDIDIRPLLDTYTLDRFDVDRPLLTKDVAATVGVSDPEWDAWYRWQGKGTKPA